MRRYQRFKLFIAVFAVLYPVISWSALGLTMRRSKNEIFPFFSWALFCFVPNEVTDYRLLISAVGDRQFDPPRDFASAKDVFPRAESIDAFMIIQDMGEYFEKGQESRLRDRRCLFESQFLGRGEGVRYELARRRYDPLEFWNTRATRSIERLHGFDYDGGGP
jgi:hypothetical protein